MKSSSGFLVGKLLIAMPGMEDPRFERSVIFVCSHDETGAMGLIVNKPVEGVRFAELLERYSLTGAEQSDGAPPDVPVLFGGPVELDRGFILHSADYSGGEGTLAINAEFSLTATVDILKEIAKGGGPRERLLALGYSGWGEGQIEDEIRANGWIHCDADAGLVFGTDYAAMWQKAIAKLGLDLAGLSANTGRA
jgi:putative transcriptional regulator